MKLAILSDTHFGDHHCTLVTPDLAVGPKFDQFMTAVGIDNDYLVLAGDILDFSISEYEQAYRVANVFFDHIKKNNIAREIIYIAGNHDSDIWHIMQHQRSVINKISAGKLPEPYIHSVPGIIDDRASKGQFSLFNVKPQPGPGPRYGGMFLDNITAPPTVFNFVYPNLYIATDRETVLVTHGQFLENYWSFLGEIAVKIAYDDLKLGEVDTKEMMEMNFPLNQLACTGVGQAGVLTKVVRMVEDDVKKGDLKRVEKYLNRLEKYVDAATDLPWWKEFIFDKVVASAKDGLLDSLKNAKDTRFNENFIHSPDVKQRFKRFYDASLLEIGTINEASPVAIPAPTRVIFGHTHQPTAWADPKAPKLDSVSSASPKRMTLHNTGGWLMAGGDFCGAEVFTYQTGTGFASVRIS
ncbi:metallophosphoesterase [Geomonas paludis]|uniref:Metallophosphoesterase n=1 Tax=Geomonas paludis TaxID=2740185 RepID=A0ABY4LE87_9BACT|nr:metallophosphoesterase [Geomonas paludis]UPU34777.1 metallophosphoesterase [Geomonas paludis]